jgi:hypothetical protein
LKSAVVQAPDMRWAWSEVRLSARDAVARLSALDIVRASSTAPRYETPKLHGIAFPARSPQRELS